MELAFQPTGDSSSVSIFDIAIENGDMKQGDSLKTAVCMSLFCDARSPTRSGGGWWADSLNGYSCGSQIWSMSGKKLTSENLALIKKYAENALQWMITDGVASSVAVSAAREGIDRMALSVTIRKPDGMQKSYKFYQLWSEI